MIHTEKVLMQCRQSLAQCSKKITYVQDQDQYKDAYKVRSDCYQLEIAADEDLVKIFGVDSCN